MLKETSEMRVTVEAESLEDAIQKVESSWKDGDYILDAEHFKGVEFTEVDG